METWAATRSGVRSERNAERLGLSAAVDRYRNVGARRVLAQDVLERMLIVDRLVVHLGDHVVDLDPGAVCRRPRCDRGDHGADHQSVRRGGSFVELVVGDAQERPVDVTRLDQLIGDIASGVAVQCEAEARTGLGLLDREVHAHYLAGRVQQGASAIAWVDLGVGLNGIEDVFDLPGARVRHRYRAVQRTDDTFGHTVLLAKRAPDGDRELSHLERARVGPVEGGQVLRIDLEDRHVIFRTGPDNTGVVLLRLVAQDDLQLARIFDHMVVGDDVTIRSDDEPGPDAVLIRRDDIG